MRDGARPAVPCAPRGGCTLYSGSSSTRARFRRSSLAAVLAALAALAASRAAIMPEMILDASHFHLGSSPL